MAEEILIVDDEEELLKAMRILKTPQIWSV